MVDQATKSMIEKVSKEQLLNDIYDDLLMRGYVVARRHQSVVVEEAAGRTVYWVIAQRR